MISVTIEPSSASPFMKRLNGSSRKAPLNISTSWEGVPMSMMRATPMMPTASSVIRAAQRSPRKAPSISRTSAPTARMNSGRIGPRWKSDDIGRSPQGAATIDAVCVAAVAATAVCTLVAILSIEGMDALITGAGCTP